MTLLDDYELWREDRADISAQEEAGNAVSDDWASSDDQGCALASQLANAYTVALRAASGVLGWELGRRRLDDLEAVLSNLRDTLDLDTTSSASRQCFIDTGRYLQNGQGRSYPWGEDSDPTQEDTSVFEDRHVPREADR